MNDVSMSLPSHIVAPLIGFATTAAAVIAMTAVVSPLLHGPEPTGRSLSAGSSTVTLSPPLRAREPLALPGPRTADAGGGGGTLSFASAPAGPSVAAAPAAGVPATFVPAASGDDEARSEGPTASRPEGLAREDALAGGAGGASAPQAEPLAPAAAVPGTTTVELPAGTVTPDGPARRFHLRVVDLQQTEHEVRVRVAIAPGPDQPETAMMTIALKPTSIEAADGQAVKVSLDVVSGNAEAPVLRVRVTLVDDGTGEASAVEGGETDTSNVVDISVPVTGTDEHAGEEPAESPAELLLTLHPVESSTGSASATPTVSVAVSVTPEPTPALEPPPADLSAPAESRAGHASAPAAEETPPPDTTVTTAAPAVASVPTPEPAPEPTDDATPPSIEPEPVPEPSPAPEAAPAPAAEPVTEPDVAEPEPASSAEPAPAPAP